MAPRWWQRPEWFPPGAVEPADPGADLVEECEAFLAGTYPVWLHRHGVVIPPWAWLNPLAHGTSAELAAVAGPVDASMAHPITWADVLSTLAAELADDRDLAARQREVLVPLELQLAAGATDVRTPDELVHVVRRALEWSVGD